MYLLVCNHHVMINLPRQSAFSLLKLFIQSRKIVSFNLKSDEFSGGLKIVSKQMS